jgi:putative NIF3 family GTP cyclohydrolase 1 type 2
MARDGRPLSEVIDALGAIAPLSLAEGWDKVGLLVAGDGRAVTRALLAIDVVPDVLDEAKELGAQLVVGYHPLIFKPLDRLDGASWQCRVAIDAVRAGIAVYSPHTALDAVAGGVNDWLLESVASASGGAVAGALIGNQFGSGSGQKIATIGGLAGGAYLGNQHIPTRGALCQ